MDGNCLFNSVLISISSDEDLADVLQMMTCIDLYLQSEKYSSHYLFHEVFKIGVFASVDSVFTACISNFVFDLNLNNNVAVQRTALH